jgi:hypothetical protein
MIQGVTDFWPPWAYYETGNYGPAAPQTARITSPLEDRVQVKPDGTRFLRYQLPHQPVEPGSVFVGGYVRSTTDGLLFNLANRQVGVIDFDTGIFEVWLDYDESPGLSSRTVEYIYPRRTSG